MVTTLEKSKPNSSIALEKLRHLIFSGELGPGTDHLESELAQNLGMSRTPVREALLVLEAQGLLDVRPRKGVRIKPLTADDLIEVYDILIELESAAAAYAATNGYSEKDLTTLMNAIVQMEQSLLQGDRDLWVQSDDAFHNELVRLGGNTRARKITEMMGDQIKRARLVTLYMGPPLETANANQREVYGAILKGEPEEARRLHRQAREETKSVLIGLLEKHRLSNL